MLTIKNSVLLVVDVQGKLATLMDRQQETYDIIQKLIKAAHILGIPIIATEQAPEKLGPTIPGIAAALDKVTPISKKSFSCWGEEAFRETLAQTQRKQIVVTGIESHVCVYQTVHDLIKNGYEPYLVCDGISSRTAFNREIGIHRSEKAGAILTSGEMTVTEWLGGAEHPHFRFIINLLKD